ncbi:phenylalanine--tRNA ligase subunit alpha [Candidatus Uhrbacteria bacterium]|jgi:phenylalanyl-tRNA synthetase alpha chain|nr:phenylalanine--tRNA ligase subunit alpha [Candidatus Uhrbacteria bacterium]
MKNDLDNIKNEFLKALEDVSDSLGLEDLRVEYLGRKGKLSQLMKQLPSMAEDVRREVGQLGNDVKKTLELAFTEVSSAMNASEDVARQQTDWIDVTQPGVRPPGGHLHLVTQAIDEVSTIFKRLGFVSTRHPEVDWDYYAFESLNMPKTHPARDEWETFFIGDGGTVQEGKKGKVVLTPHTSNGQVREMEKKQLPIRMININKTYRRQSDASHTPMFHQFEGLMIDKGVTITHLKGVFDYFVKEFFGPEREVRLRPFHFRFTEPSMELDITCGVCLGSGENEGMKCKICKEGWVELGGAGMVHPNVLRAGGLDPDVYSGFAFGWGVERTMVMKSDINIDDIRVLYRNDLRFLEQF